jgi:hypothetical protein
VAQGVSRPEIAPFSSCWGIHAGSRIRAECAGAAVDLAHDAQGATAEPGGLAGPAGQAENGAPADYARVVRWAGPAFVLFSLLLLPWTIYLGYSLPARQVSRHYDVAWAGFDVMLLVVLAGTGYLALRRSLFLAIAAAALLVVVDAWFDVMTSPPGQLPEPAAMAVIIELPLASVCVWLSYHTEKLAERRVVRLLRRNTQARPAGRR